MYKLYMYVLYVYEVCICVYLCICVYMYVYVCTVYVCICMYMCVFVCECVSLWLYNVVYILNGWFCLGHIYPVDYRLTLLVMMQYHEIVW